MDNTLATILSGGFMVALVHAALPTHWLPFALTGRAQGWRRSRTLMVVAIAGTAHVLFTTLLGLLIVWIGISVHEGIGEVFHGISTGILLVLGVYYITRQLMGKRHEHHHSAAGLFHGGLHEHTQEDAYEHRHKSADRITMGSLLAMLTLSPCESFLPVYLSGVSYGWQGFALLSTVLAIATLGSMVILTWIATVSVERVDVRLISRYEHAIVGALLCCLGIVSLLIEH